MTQTLNATETMKLLRITRGTLKAMLASGELRGFERGKVIRVSRQSVKDLLGGVRRTETPTPPVAAEAHSDLAQEDWKLLLLVGRTARRASFELGPRGVGEAVDFGLLDADDALCARARVLLASLAAKGDLGRGVDLRLMDEVILAHRTIPAA